MTVAPENVTLASGFVAAPAAQVWPVVATVAGWPHLFPGWTAKIADDDDRFTATGPGGERFDLYPTGDDEQLALDVEVVDELGSADTLRLRLLPATGGCFVTIAHGRLTGMPEPQWQAKRAAIAAGIERISDLL